MTGERSEDRGEAAATWMEQPEGAPLSFHTVINLELAGEFGRILGRRVAVSGTPAGLWIGLGTALLAAATAFWFEMVSRWVAIEETGAGAAALDPNGRPFIPVLLLALGFLAVGFVGRWAEQMLGARAVTQARLKLELLRDPAELRMDARGLSVTGAQFETRYDWALVEEVRAERLAVWLVIGAGGVPIPRPEIGGPVEVETLLSRIEAFREAAGG